MSNTFWTKERLIAEATLYTSMKEWRAHSFTSFMRAYQQGCLAECCAHIKRLRAKKGEVNKEQCLKIAMQFQSRSEWCKMHRSSYDMACKKGWLEECCAHMKPSIHKVPRGYWKIKENVLIEAKKYSSRYAFSKNAQTAYLNARNEGYLDEACAHMD